MANNLKKIKGLTASRDLADRVGVAMFMYAREIDLEGESTPEKILAKWAIGNPMQADQTMLALVATDTAVVENTTVAEEVTPATANRAANPNALVNRNYTPVDVVLDEVSDDAIVNAVAENWTRVAQKYAAPEPVEGTATVVAGNTEYNPFLDDGPAPIPRMDDSQMRPQRQ